MVSQQMAMQERLWVLDRDLTDLSCHKIGWGMRVILRLSPLRF